MTKIQLVTQDCHSPPGPPPEPDGPLLSWKPRATQVLRSTAGLLSYLLLMSLSCRCCPALPPSSCMPFQRV